MDIEKSWQRLLQEMELAKNYHLPYQLDGGLASKNPVLEYLLPSLLYIKLVAILDEALAHFVAQAQLTMPRPYRKDLNGRIDFVCDCGFLGRPGLLHEIRDLRNSLAHETSGNISWASLESDLAIIQEELRLLGLVGERPEYRYFGERGQAQDSEEPGIAYTQDYRYGLTRDGQVTTEISFTRKGYQ